MQSLSRAERETILRFSEDLEELMTVETFNEKQAQKLIRAGAEVKRHAGRGASMYWTLLCPREWFRWPRKVSEAKLAAGRAAGERLRMAREAGIAQGITGENPGEGE